MVTSVAVMVISGVDDLRDTLAQQLPQRIHIVGIYRHDIAMGMGVKIFDGKRLPSVANRSSLRWSMVPWLTLTMIRL